MLPLTPCDNGYLETMALRLILRRLVFYSTREDREHTADAMFASEARETVERDEPSSNLRVSTSCYGGWR